MKKYCHNCNEVLTGKYCSACGRDSAIARIDKKFFWQEFLGLVGYKSGFLFTIENLLLRPGKTLKKFLKVERDSFTKPTTFLILTAFLHTVISQFLKTDLYLEQSSNSGGGTSTFDVMGTWVQNHYGYTTLLMILPIAFWFKVLFKKFNYNFYEILFVVCFVIGQGLLILSVQDIISYFFKSNVLDIVFNAINYLYTIWALGQFFNNKISGYLKSFAAYLLGMLSFLVMLGLFAVLYHFIK